MINNSSLEKWNRLREKDYSQQFVNEIIEGLNCSPFEAKAILETVHRVFKPFFDTSGALRPGQIYFSVISQKAPPSRALKDCPMVTVVLTLDAGDEDLRLKERRGVVALRQHRLERICHEALSQGGLLTVEDIAHRLFNCGERTVCRDLAVMRKHHVSPPLRSTIKDMGRTISHRSQIVEQWLRGKDESKIARDNCHSVPAVQNYIEKFKRTIALIQEGYDINSVSFLVRISPELVKQYFKVYKAVPIMQFRRKELLGFLKKETAGARTPRSLA